MTRPHDLWKDLQLYGWLVFFLYMILWGRDRSYLADLQVNVLLVGALLLVVILFADLLWKQGGAGTSLSWRHHAALASETAGHWTPLLLVWIMGVTTLNLDAGSLRNGIQMRVYDPSPREERFDPARLAPGAYFSVTLIDLYAGDSLLDVDARVELIGRTTRMTGKEAEERFPEMGKAGVLLLYRFAMACCAADATPLAVVLENVPAGLKPREGDWLKVRGVTRLLPGEPKILAIRVDAAESIPQPDRPYLSWLDSM